VGVPSIPGERIVTFVLTREQLYDLVWSEPMQRLSKQIGISDVAIAKHCRKVGVPVPQRGYWNKLQAGKGVAKANLSAPDLVTVNRVQMSGSLPAQLRDRIKGEPGKTDEDNDSIEVRTERLRKRLGTVTVPRNFSRVHPAIAVVLKKEDKLRQESANSPYGFSWNKPKFDAPFERRRLLFLNGLFLGFEKVGGRPWVRGPEAREHAIFMGESSIRFTLEKLGNGGHTRGRPSLPVTHVPERLYLSVCDHDAPPGVAVRWQDQEGNSLEKQLTEVVIGMAVAGEHLHRQWLEQQAAWERERRDREEREAQRRKEEAARRELERLAAEEKAKLDTLIRDAVSWRTANTIRSYIEARRNALACASADSSELETWVNWALAAADELDPLVSGTKPPSRR
jgi:hypothetical protein